jgi:hypothetical protein
MRADPVGRIRWFLTIGALFALFGTTLVWVQAQTSAGAVAIDADDIGGVVTGPNGPEAGVWVIAETTSLPTKFARIVVTDDQGRYVLPDLPVADYQVWVRGYGLVDSQKWPGKRGQRLNLTARTAPSAAAAADYYPAAYWLALMNKPVGQCGLACHQIGNKGTREIPPSILQQSTSSLDAWDRRTATGPEGAGMFAGFKRLGDDRKAFADWTDRIAKGELPKEKPKRPAGLERNLVISIWDWGTKYDGRTDAVASDLRSGAINPNGKVYMVARSPDTLAILDPNEHDAKVIRVPSNAPETLAKSPRSAYWGEEPIWKRRSEPRSTAMDADGRVWLTAIVRERPTAQPAFCAAETNKFAKHFPIKSLRGYPRQAAYFDPKTEQFTQIPDVCTNLDHNQLGPDDYLYFGADDVVFWLDTKKYLSTKNAEASQGWCPAVVDTNGDGKITQWTEPDQPIDPARDHRVEIGCYQIAVDPNDKTGIAWCGDTGRLTRVVRGADAPNSCRAEVYKPPTGMTPEVSGPGHATVDSQGVVWMVWRGSQHLTSFDRRKCRTPVSGATAATGEGCREGWTVHKMGGPNYEGTNVEADMTYLPQIDRWDTLGQGKDLPVWGSVNQDSLRAYNPGTNQFLELRVPYPMGFFSRSANGRVDNPTTGWKGKGLWSSFSTYAPWHTETGYADQGRSGHGSHAVKFQMRPSPLAK